MSDFASLLCCWWHDLRRRSIVFQVFFNFELASLRAAGRVRALELTACGRSFVGEHACVVFGYTWVFLGT